MNTTPKKSHASPSSAKSMGFLRSASPKQKQKTTDPKTPERPRPKPQWDSTLHDLSVHRLSPEEQKRRKESAISKHIEEVREEFHRNAPGDNSSETTAIYSTPKKDMSFELDSPLRTPVRKTHQEIMEAISIPRTPDGQIDVGALRQRLNEGFLVKEISHQTPQSSIIDFEDEIQGFQKQKSSPTRPSQSQRPLSARQYKVAVPIHDPRRVQSARGGRSESPSNLKKPSTKVTANISLDDFEHNVSELETRMRKIETAMQPKSSSPVKLTDAPSDAINARLTGLESLVRELEVKLRHEAAQRATISNSLILCNRRIDDLNKDLTSSRQENETLRKELARVVLHYEQEIVQMKRDLSSKLEQRAAYNLDSVIDKLNSAHDVSSYLDSHADFAVPPSESVIFYEAKERSKESPLRQNHMQPTSLAPFTPPGAALKANAPHESNPRVGAETSPSGHLGFPSSQQGQHPRAVSSPSRVIYRNPQVVVSRHVPSGTATTAQGKQS